MSKQRSAIGDISLGPRSLRRYLRERLRPLARLPASTPIPYVSAYFDWAPEGERPGERPSVVEFEHGVTRLLESLEPRSAAFESVGEDVSRIRSYLATIDPSARGATFFACCAKDVFEPRVLQVPIANGLLTSPTPALARLSHAIDDNPPYAVVIADHRKAAIWLMNQTVSLERERTGYHLDAKFHEDTEHFVRSVVGETIRLMAASETDLLVLAGRQEVRGRLRHAFAQGHLSDRVIASVDLDVEVDKAELIEATRPVLTMAKRIRAAEAARALYELASVSRVATGAVRVLDALEEGAVDTLVLTEDFDEPGWADYALPALGVGAPPREHPLGGEVTNIVPVALKEEFVRLAILSDADIVFVRDEQSSVGATLKFMTY